MHRALSDPECAQYAVRGELYLKGAELKKAGRDIIFTNGEVCEADSAHEQQVYSCMAAAQSATPMCWARSP